MKTKLLLFLSATLLVGCVSDYDRVEDCKIKYKNSIVTPSTGFIRQRGYEITVEDTLTGQIYAVSYYPFSSKKIYTIINIR